MTGCRAIEGVTSVKAKLDEKTLTLRFDPAVTSRERVLAAVDAIVAAIH